MIFISLREFGDMLSKKVTSDLLGEAWRLNGITHNMLFVNYFDKENKCREHCFKEGFDPDTTMVMYDMPRSNPNGDPVSQEVIDREEAGPTLASYSQCMCMFYPNMTPEKMANQIHQVLKLKAFI